MVEVPKAVIFAIIAMATLAIIILLAIFFTSKGGGQGSLMSNITNWANVWKL
jgi:hypothetical protein